MKGKYLLVCLLWLVAGCASQPESAFVAVAENAREGGMRIASIDGIPVSEVNGYELSVGEHKIAVACQLANGVGASFQFDVDLLPNHSYCFFSRDQGKSCTIVYTQIDWQGGGVVTCK